MKRCLKCGCEKPLSEFGANQRTKDGLNRWCLGCAKASTARWRAADPEHARELNRLAARTEKRKEAQKRWQKANPTKVRAALDRYKQTHPERVRDAVRRWQTAHADLKRKIDREQAAKQRKQNPQLTTARVRRAIKKRIAQDPFFRLRNKIEASIHQALKKSHALPSTLGYTLDDLRARLASQFKPDMSWLNFGRGKDRWQIDHIRPVASFNPDNYPTPEQMMRECFALSNLQPLWARDNFGKRAIWNGYVWRMGKPIYGVPAIGSDGIPRLS